MTVVTNVAVVATGGIGASWAAYFLAQGLTVHAYDPHPEGERLVLHGISLHIRAGEMVGVIGPTRMAYERVIPIVDITAKLLSNALSHS